MRRRNYLTLLGSGVLGWWGNKQTTRKQQECETTTAAGAETVPETTTDDVIGADSQTDSPPPNLVVESSELKTLNTFLGHHPAVDATIHNTSTTPTGLFKVTVDCLNSDGDAIASSPGFLDFLAGGGTWSARIAPSLEDVDPSDVVDYNLFVPTPSPLFATMNPDGLTVQSKSLVTSDVLDLRSEVKNERDSPVSFTAIGSVYNSDGHVLTTEEASIDDLPAGETGQLQMQVTTYGRDDQIEETQITLLI
jgi:hypothetical protein